MCRLIPTLLTPLGPTIEGAGPELLRRLLGQFEDRLRAADVPIDANLGPGLAPEDVSRLLDEVGLVVPAELMTWFGWRNGLITPVGRLGAGILPFLARSSLELSCANYRYGVAHHGALWSVAKGWLPLETHPHGLHAFVGEETDRLLVRRASEDFPLEGMDAGYQVVSLSTIVEWWIQAIDEAAATWDSVRQVWHFDLRSRPSVQLATGML